MQCHTGGEHDAKVVSQRLPIGIFVVEVGRDRPIGSADFQFGIVEKDAGIVGRKGTENVLSKQRSGRGGIVIIHHLIISGIILLQRKGIQVAPLLSQLIQIPVPVVPPFAYQGDEMKFRPT